MPAELLVAQLFFAPVDHLPFGVNVEEITSAVPSDATEVITEPVKIGIVGNAVACAVGDPSP